MFHSARLKLTAWYLLIIMVVSLSFSALIYGFVSRELTRFERMHRERIQEGIVGVPGRNQLRPFRIPISPELIEETQDRIVLILIGVNVVIFVISGGLGYFLAGRTLKPIKEMMDEQNRFISDASHELKTPLTSLKTAFEVYLRDKKASISESKTLAEESLVEVDKLQTLSESLLQLAQYQKPNGHLKFEKLLIEHVVEEAVYKMKKTAAKKKITIKQVVEKLEITANKYSLCELLIILLDNAVKYSPTKAVVLVEVMKKDSTVQLSVTDRGIGISQDDVSHIFDRFYRADDARSKTDVGGYGLGLSIAKKIVDMHNGDIRVESELGNGATFIVSLPLDQSSSKTS